ncbi:SDR family NAD(P)-dependent oxidoreductase [Roseiarcaceae bacterium H3SJ34-1]|uniref:SDR family NAD(P)-dependent oxidoreductase n=1 Tax=Terripilifer ovatus TaxID=3032367 RepID=UPI003AB9A9BC|nr:SDR family NAD(P)-dependent oxidoreductase [Roseiarcaceae bacterium H3SJ34-1]
MPTVFITGARTGLGQEFASQYGAAGWKVIAPTRSDMDVTDNKSIQAYVASLDGAPVDLLINNAGVRSTEPAACKLGAFTLDAWLPSLAINAVGPALVTQSLVENLKKGEQKKVVTLSSRLGSIAGGGGSNSGGSGSSYYAYRVSKSAVNQVNRCLSIDLGPFGFTCVVMNPGWVKTKMGGAGASMSPQDSVEALRGLIAQLDPSRNGQFLEVDGTVLPW